MPESRFDRFSCGRQWTALAVMIIVIAGCGPDDGLAIVTGTVTLDGNPLAGAVVQFQPVKGRPSTGMTNKQGEYRLAYTRDKTGALIGQHEVTISTADASEDFRAKEAVPGKYNTETQLVREVAPGNNDIPFDLNSD